MTPGPWKQRGEALVRELRFREGVVHGEQTLSQLAHAAARYSGG